MASETHYLLNAEEGQVMRETKTALTKLTEMLRDYAYTRNVGHAFHPVGKHSQQPVNRGPAVRAFDDARELVKSYLGEDEYRQFLEPYGQHIADGHLNPIFDMLAAKKKTGFVAFIFDQKIAILKSFTADDIKYVVLNGMKDSEEEVEAINRVEQLSSEDKVGELRRLSRKLFLAIEKDLQDISKEQTKILAQTTKSEGNKRGQLSSKIGTVFTTASFVFSAVTLLWSWLAHREATNTSILAREASESISFKT